MNYVVFMFTASRGIGLAILVAIMTIGGCACSASPPSSSGPPCTNAAITKAFPRAERPEGFKSLTRLRCQEGWAASFTMVQNPGDPAPWRLDAWAVFKAEGSKWKFVRFAGDGVCRDIGMPKRVQNYIC